MPLRASSPGDGRDDRTFFDSISHPRRIVGERGIVDEPAWRTCSRWFVGTGLRACPRPLCLPLQIATTGMDISDTGGAAPTEPEICVVSIGIGPAPVLPSVPAPDVGQPRRVVPTKPSHQPAPREPPYRPLPKQAFPTTPRQRPHRAASPPAPFNGMNGAASSFNHSPAPESA